MTKLKYFFIRNYHILFNSNKVFWIYYLWMPEPQLGQRVEFAAFDFAIYLGNNTFLQLD